MTVWTIKPELEPALIEFGRSLRRASIYFLKNLPEIADVASLRAGDEDHDYFLAVPADRFDDTAQRLASLLRTVKEQFDVEITVKPIAAEA